MMKNKKKMNEIKAESAANQRAVKLCPIDG